MAEKDNKGTSLLKALVVERRLPTRYKEKYDRFHRKASLITWRARQNKMLQALIGNKKHAKLDRIDLKEKDRKEGPNVIFIVLDTVRAKDLPMYGGEALTPFLSKFAENATVYKNAYTCAGWTIPSHASMFTGVYPNKHKTNHWTQKLDESYKTLAELLKEKGYATLCYTDNELICKENGLAKGFDHYGYSHNEFGGIEEKAMRSVKIMKRSPFFLFVNFMTTHIPYMINPDCFAGLSKDQIAEIYKAFHYKGSYLDKLKIPASDDHLGSKELWHKGYLSALNHLDMQLSRLFLRLSKAGLLKNSVVVITSDHGEEIYDHKINLDDCEHYILQHYTTYNTTIKIPLMIRHMKDTDRHVEKKVSNMDIFPTILEEVGIKVPEGLDAVSLFSSDRNKIYSDNSLLRCASLIKDDYKINRFKDKTELYNIKEDPDEIDPLDMPDKLLELEDELSEHKKQNDADQDPRIDKSDEEIMKEKLKSLGYI